MPVLTESDLRQHLSSGGFASLYVIFGEEKYLVKRAAVKLIKKAAGEAFPEFNRNEFPSTAGIDDVADAAEALPFLAEHKCVAVADFNLEEKNQVELNKLNELLDNLPESTTLVFWYPTLEFDPKKSAKWRNFLKKAENRGCTLFCKRREASDLRKLLLKEAEKAGCMLSKDNASRIVEYVGPDLNALLNEMEKLCAFADGGEITRSMIEDMVPKSTETTVFLMANALTAGSYEKAYQLLDQLFSQNEEPLSILGALSSSYVDMYRVRAALQSGLPATAPSGYGEYRGREFRLRNAERSAKGISEEGLRRSLDLLLQADLQLKGSKLDARIVMEELIAKLLLAAKGEAA